MRGRYTALLLVLLTVTWTSGAPQNQDSQDPWLQILNGGTQEEVVVEPRQDQYQFEETDDQEEPIEVIQNVDQRQPQPRPQRPQRLPQKPQRFTNRRQQPPRPLPPRRPLRPGRRPVPGGRPSRPGGQRHPPTRHLDPTQAPGILGSIGETLGDGYTALKCSGSNILTDAKLKDEAFIKFQLNCARGLGKCDDIGKKIKVLAPEVLAGRCPKPCNECTKIMIKKVMAELQNKYPIAFQELLTKGRQRG